MAISRFKRVTDALHNNEGRLDVSLRFAVDDAGQPHVRGRISGELALICQRCMQEMSWPLDIRICLGLVRTDKQIEQLPDIYEPALVGDEPSLLVELIEDEVILALPQAPLHELQHCPAADLATSLADTIPLATR